MSNLEVWSGLVFSLMKWSYFFVVQNLNKCNFKSCLTDTGCNYNTQKWSSSFPYSYEGQQRQYKQNPNLTLKLNKQHLLPTMFLSGRHLRLLCNTPESWGDLAQMQRKGYFGLQNSLICLPPSVPLPLVWINRPGEAMDVVGGSVQGPGGVLSFNDIWLL